MQSSKTVTIVLLALALVLGGCSRQQSDWQKARETNTTEAYEQFLKHYPNGDFTAQAQARLKDLYTERDWEKARDADTPEAYQLFLTQHPEGKLADEARTRIENFNLAQPPAVTTAGGSSTPQAAAAAPDGESAPTRRTGAGAPSTTATPGGEGTPSARRGSARESSGAVMASAKAKKPHYGVQLGAFRSGAAAAHRRWAKLKKDYPQILKGLSSTVLPTRTTKGMLYRLQAVGVTESHARSICKSLRARSQACVVVHTARA